MIDDKNWTHSVYINPSKQILARLSFGAEWTELGPKDLYYLCLTNKEHETISQESFSDLRTAIRVINEKYANWSQIELSDLEKKKSGDGCDTCQAH